MVDLTEGSKVSVKDGLLALLARGPSYGYQLKGDFEDATGGAWNLNIGQVYTSLQRLERDGLIEALSANGEEDDRRSFTLTAAGREHLSGWLAEPLPRTIEERDEVAMKVLLAASTPGQDPRAVIAAQRASTMASLQAYTRQKAQSPRPTLATAVHLDRLILTCRSELDWLDLAEDRIADPALARPRAADDIARANGNHDTTTTTSTTATEGAPR
ncbi:helix-turn-helix transcriptional regulator [soil metagenome]